jgi:hypothetical protein
MDRLQEETDAKIAVLQEQAAQARADLKARIEARIDEVRADYDRRSAKLQRVSQ